MKFKISNSRSSEENQNNIISGMFRLCTTEHNAFSMNQHESTVFSNLVDRQLDRATHHFRVRIKLASEPTAPHRPSHRSNKNNGRNRQANKFHP